ncbi:PREDICTED: uncharacterized protein LOC107334177 isoform X1 [Acropora digitifera]|uniref:uncharacterized protein LOC107334177 isoform X1 n=1 Tax=Acropora digitifera TaxID=70779 RepID=UPI000779F4A7|nr:PREDICTED: uncharacterized protein LOC107334177 isoform X1 [Acropora digitifera]
MAACGGRLLRTSRLGQISQARIRITQPRRNISSSGAEKQGSLLRRVITDWKTPSIMFLTGVAGCLFYERFIEEPDETGTRDPLITRLMIEYLMPDPETEQQKRNEHLRLMRERCDAYLELKRKPNLGLQPFDIEYIEKDIQRAPEFGPDHY